MVALLHAWIGRPQVSRDRLQFIPTERRQSGCSGRLGSWSVQSDGLFSCAPVSLRVVEVDLSGVGSHWQSNGSHYSSCTEYAMEVGEIAGPADHDVGILK